MERALHQSNFDFFKNICLRKSLELEDTDDSLEFKEVGSLVWASVCDEGGEGRVSDPSDSGGRFTISTMGNSGSGGGTGGQGGGTGGQGGGRVMGGEGGMSGSTSEVEMERGGWGARRFFVDGVFGSLVGGEGNSASQKHNFFV